MKRERKQDLFLWFIIWTGSGVDHRSEQTWHVQLSKDQWIKQQSGDIIWTALVELASKVLILDTHFLSNPSPDVIVWFMDIRKSLYF